jgi:hypothetical protein
MDEDRREFLKAFSGRRLARIVGQSVFAGLDAVSELRRATGPSLDEAGMALRDRRKGGLFGDVLAGGAKAAARRESGREGSTEAGKEEETQ